MTVSDIDAEILKVLLEDGRTTLTSIGEQLGVSRFAIRNGVDRLFEAGVIRGPTVIVDPRTVGYRRTVFFEFKTNPHEPWLAERLENMENCEALDGTAGEYSLLARFRFKDDNQFSRVLRDVDKLLSRTMFKRYRFVGVTKCYKESGTVFSEEARREAQLDEVDYRILEILQSQWKHAHGPLPLTTTEISKTLRASGFAVSQPAVYRRIERLEKERVILRHTILVDHTKLGENVKFILRMKVDPAVYDGLARNLLAPMSAIADLYRTGEDYGLLAVVRVGSISEYNGFLVGLYDMEGLLDTFSVLVLDERKRSVVPVKTA